MGKRGASSGFTAPAPTAAQPMTTPSGHTLAEVQGMNDDQLHDFLINVYNVDTPDFLNTHHTQKMVYGLGLNDKPQVVPDAQLQQMIKNGATPIWRSVNDKMLPGGVKFTGADILDMLRSGDLTYLGDGKIGDGLYFSDDLTGSKGYGRDGTIQGILSPNAKVVDSRQLKTEYDQFVKSHPVQGGRSVLRQNAAAHGGRTV